MIKKNVCLLIVAVVTTFSFGQDTTTTIVDTVTQTSTADESAPGILFWVSCFIAGALPWIFIALMKQRNKGKK